MTFHIFPESTDAQTLAILPANAFGLLHALLHNGPCWLQILSYFKPHGEDTFHTVNRIFKNNPFDFIVAATTEAKLLWLDYQLCRQVTDGSLNNNRGGRLAMMEIGIRN